MRPLSKVAPDWWDYTTLDREILDDAARLTADDLLGLSRPGFKVVFYDTLEDFYLAEALEYITAWRQATPDTPAGICGPIGPTEQLPLVARLVNELEIDLRHAHFWGMDEWVVDGMEVPVEHPLSFRARGHGAMLQPHPSRPADAGGEPALPGGRSDGVQGKLEARPLPGDAGRPGRGEALGVQRSAAARPARTKTRRRRPTSIRKLETRIVELHPMTLIQNARTSGGGVVQNVPSQALSVGPAETWKAEKVSIWQAGSHDNPFGMRLTTLMIAKHLPDAAVPMSLLADHPNVQFNFYRHGIGTTSAEMH